MTSCGPHNPGRTARRGSVDSTVAYLIGPAFLLLALWFLVGPETVKIPFAERVKVAWSSDDCAEQGADR